MPEPLPQRSEPAETPQGRPVERGVARTPIWRTAIARKVTALACLIAAAALEYYLVNIPVAEVGGEFPPATVRARAATVTFDHPGLVDGGTCSFGYTPPTEREKVLVDAYFDNAQLSQPTVQAFRSFQISAPASAGPITYLTSTVGQGACSTKFEVTPVSLPESIQFSQTSSDSLQGYRSLGTSFAGSEAEVTLTSQGAMQNILSPCKVELAVGDWKQVTAGFFPIKIRVPAGAHFRFRWQDLDEKSAIFENKSAALTLVQFGPLASDQFTAGAIRITSANPKSASNPPRLEALAEHKSSLTVESFAINKNQLEVSASGKGKVLKDGKVVTKTNVLEALNKNPTLSALFGAGNLALIG